MMEKVITGLIALACAVWGTWLFVRIVKDKGDQKEQAAWRMSPRWRVVSMVLLATAIAGAVLIANAWHRFTDGAVVAQATRNTWTYQLRAYRDLPFDEWLSGFQCEIARGERVFYMAPFPAGDSPAYRATDCSVSLAESGAVFRVGDNVYVFEWKRDGVAWFRGNMNSGANQPSEGTR